MHTHNNIRIIYTVLALLTSSAAYADTSDLSNLIEELQEEDKQKEERVREYLEQKQATRALFGTKSHRAKKVKIKLKMRDIEHGIPVYYDTFNAKSAKSTKTSTVHQAPYNLQGEGYHKLGIWDGGGILTTHDELAGRVVQMNEPKRISSHSTHVAGTMIASGQRQGTSVKGMAPKASLIAYDLENDTTEMAQAASRGMELSNHSYGRAVGWYEDKNNNLYWLGNTKISQYESYLFGFYTTYAQYYDKISNAAPYYLAVFAAGNDRRDVVKQSGLAHKHNDEDKVFTDTHYNDNFDNGGYDTISPASTAKNILTVGAIHAIENYNIPQDVKMSAFSAWGPTDDGRIKPDLVGVGVSVLSCSSKADDSYAYISGTSMAAPNVTGSLVLLREYYQQTHSGSRMQASTLKALAIHTAKEAGAQVGPDYKFGWGVLDTEKAVKLIQADEEHSTIMEEELSEGETFQKDIVLPANLASFKVTIVWNDPAGTVPSPVLDPSDRILVNDLDLKLVHNGESYFPWRLNKNRPAQAAKNNRANHVDNVEQVYIDNPTEGVYTIEIGHSGNLKGNQKFSIIVDATVGESSGSKKDNLKKINLSSATYAAWSTSSEKENNKYVSYYTFTLDTQRKIKIDLKSKQDTYLYLLKGKGSNGALITEDDDSGRGLNSRIIRTLPAGSYTIKTTTYRKNRTGKYELVLDAIN